jgi:hypothetical protein
MIGMTGALGRLASSKHFLTQPQRFFVAEQLRDTADEIDGGEGERRRRLKRMTMVSTCGPRGRPLYKLT